LLRQVEFFSIEKEFVISNNRSLAKNSQAYRNSGVWAFPKTPRYKSKRSDYLEN